MKRNIAAVMDAARKMMPQSAQGGAQVLPEVAAMQRPAAQARGQLRQVRKPRTK